ADYSARGRLSRSLLTLSDEDRAGHTWTQRRDQEGLDQSPALVVDIEEAAQFADIAAALGWGQRTGAAGAMKSRWRTIYYPPPLGVDLDRPPSAVAQVEIKLPSVICDPQIDGRFLAVKQGLGLEQFHRGADGLRARALAGLPVVGPQQEELERAGADRVILEVPIDPHGGPAVLVRIAEELDSGLEHQPDQSVRSRPAVAALQGQRSAEHVLDQVRFFVLLEDPAPVLPGERIPAPDCGKGEYRLGRDQPLRIFRDQGLEFTQEQQGQFDRDAAR